MTSILNLIKGKLNPVYTVIVVLILLAFFVFIFQHKTKINNLEKDNKILIEKNEALQQIKVNLEVSLEAKLKELKDNTEATIEREKLFAQSRTREANLRKDLKKAYEENEEAKKWANMLVPDCLFNIVHESSENKPE